MRVSREQLPVIVPFALAAVFAVILATVARPIAGHMLGSIYDFIAGLFVWVRDAMMFWL